MTEDDPKTAWAVHDAASPGWMTRLGLGGRLVVVAVASSVAAFVSFFLGFLFLYFGNASLPSVLLVVVWLPLMVGVAAGMLTRDASRRVLAAGLAGVFGAYVVLLAMGASDSGTTILQVFAAMAGGFAVGLIGARLLRRIARAA